MGNKVDKEQKEVVFDKKEIFPEEISAIPSSVKAISLYHCKIHDGVIDKIAKSLTTLNLLNCRIGDKSLPSISKLPHLTQLNLGSNSITDGGLIHLRNLPSLKSLFLYSNRISDEGICQLSKLSKLVSLNVSKIVIKTVKNRIGDEGAVSMAKLHLRIVNSSQNQIGGYGNRRICGIRQLSIFSYSTCEVGMQIQIRLPNGRRLLQKGVYSRDSDFIINIGGF